VRGFGWRSMLGLLMDGERVFRLANGAMMDCLTWPCAKGC